MNKTTKKRLIVRHIQLDMSAIRRLADAVAKTIFAELMKASKTKR